MDSQKNVSAIGLPSSEIAAPVVSDPVFPAPGQEFYLPFGSTDPDIYIPADSERRDRGFFQWLRALPLFGR
jgi:hypothetical protein